MQKKRTTSKTLTVAKGNRKLCSIRPLESHMRFREIGPITFGSRARDISFCVLRLNLSERNRFT